MRSEPLEYQHDGVTCRGELVWDDAVSGLRPGIFIAHEGGGFNDHGLRRARLLAELGYVALAGDLYGDRRRSASREEMFSLIGSLRSDPDRLRGRVAAGIAALRSAANVDPARVGAIGFCFGGNCVLELARSGADVAGVVSFHGLLDATRPAERGQVKAKVLACHGHTDPLAKPDALVAFMKEMEDAEADFQVLVFGRAAHGFMNSDLLASPPMTGFFYDAPTEKRAWTAMQIFFSEVFGRDGMPESR